MNEVQRSGRTVLFVSHNMATIENLCTRTIVLNEGKVAFSGPSKQAVEYYLQKIVDRRPLGDNGTSTSRWSDASHRNYRSKDEVIKYTGVEFRNRREGTNSIHSLRRSPGNSPALPCVQRRRTAYFWYRNRHRKRHGRFASKHLALRSGSSRATERRWIYRSALGRREPHARPIFSIVVARGVGPDVLRQH